MSIEEGEEYQRSRIAGFPVPPFYLTKQDAESISLPAACECGLFEIMSRRRTVRSARAEPIALAALAECLYAGMGIVGHTENCVGKLPLKMTPSGGARNPYEAYLYLRAVAGLEPGFYHYAAIYHTLRRLKTEEAPLPSELLGNQQWADEMPCIVFLCAHFERPMWKYNDANAYRVVLMEAGHIGQNIMLAATRRGLSACPTAALNHSRINECIQPTAGLTHAPIYALTLAHPLEEDECLTTEDMKREPCWWP